MALLPRDVGVVWATKRAGRGCGLVPSELGPIFLSGLVWGGFLEVDSMLAILFFWEKGGIWHLQPTPGFVAPFLRWSFGLR